MAAHAERAHSIADAIRLDRLALRELASLWSAREITELEWRQARRDLARRLDDHEAQLVALEALSPRLQIAGKGRDLAAEWGDMEPDKRREIITLVVEAVVVQPVVRANSPRDRMEPVWRTLGT